MYGHPGADGGDRGDAKGGDNRTGEYVPAPEGWWKDAPEHDEVYRWGQGSGVVADGPDRILVGFTGDRGRPGVEIPRLARNMVVEFDADGNISQRWSQWDTLIGFPHQLYISPYDPERHVWIVDRGGGPHYLEYQFGAYCCTRGGFNGGFSRPHQMNVDADGNLYVANFDGGYITKYTPRPDADPNKLVAQPMLMQGPATD